MTEEWERTLTYFDSTDPNLRQAAKSRIDAAPWSDMLRGLAPILRVEGSPTTRALAVILLRAKLMEGRGNKDVVNSEEPHIDSQACLDLYVAETESYVRTQWIELLPCVYKMVVQSDSWPEFWTMLKGLVDNPPKDNPTEPLLLIERVVAFEGVRSGLLAEGQLFLMSVKDSLRSTDPIMRRAAISCSGALLYNYAAAETFAAVGPIIPYVIEAAVADGGSAKSLRSVGETLSTLGASIEQFVPDPMPAIHILCERYGTTAQCDESLIEWQTEVIRFIPLILECLPNWCLNNSLWELQAFIFIKTVDAQRLVIASESLEEWGAKLCVGEQEHEPGTPQRLLVEAQQSMASLYELLPLCKRNALLQDILARLEDSVTVMEDPADATVMIDTAASLATVASGDTAGLVENLGSYSLSDNVRVRFIVAEALLGIFEYLGAEWVSYEREGSFVIRALGPLIRDVSIRVSVAAMGALSKFLRAVSGEGFPNLQHEVLPLIDHLVSQLPATVEGAASFKEAQRTVLVSVLDLLAAFLSFADGEVAVGRVYPVSWDAVEVLLRLDETENTSMVCQEAQRLATAMLGEAGPSARMADVVLTNDRILRCVLTMTSNEPPEWCDSNWKHCLLAAIENLAKLPGNLFRVHTGEYMRAFKMVLSKSDDLVKTTVLGAESTSQGLSTNIDGNVFNIAIPEGLGAFSQFSYDMTVVEDKQTALRALAEIVRVATALPSFFLKDCLVICQVLLGGKFVLPPLRRAIFELMGALAGTLGASMAAEQFSLPSDCPTPQMADEMLCSLLSISMSSSLDEFTKAAKDPEMVETEAGLELFDLESYEAPLTLLEEVIAAYSIGKGSDGHSNTSGTAVRDAAPQLGLRLAEMLELCVKNDVLWPQVDEEEQGLLGDSVCSVKSYYMAKEVIRRVFEALGPDFLAVFTDTVKPYISSLLLTPTVHPVSRASAVEVFGRVIQYGGQSAIEEYVEGYVMIIFNYLNPESMEASQLTEDVLTLIEASSFGIRVTAEVAFSKLKDVGVENVRTLLKRNRDMLNAMDGSLTYTALHRRSNTLDCLNSALLHLMYAESVTASHKNQEALQRLLAFVQEPGRFPLKFDDEEEKSCSRIMDLVKKIT